MIIFTRIVRTGGTSFWYSIKDNFKRGELWQKESFEKQQYQSVGGIVNALRLERQFDKLPKMFMHHLPYGAHKLFKAKKFDYITFLREPIERTISCIKYAASLTYDTEYEEYLKVTGYFRKQLFLQGYLREFGAVKKEELTNPHILRVIMKCIENETCCNIMTKQLSGAEEFGNMKATYAFRAGNLYPINHTNQRKYTDKEMEILLSKAKTNLKKYKFVGFHEDKDGQKKACTAVGLKYKDHGIIYRGYDKLPLSGVNWRNKLVRESIAAMNVYDKRLYRFARTYL